MNVNSNKPVGDVVRSLQIIGNTMQYNVIGSRDVIGDLVQSIAHGHFAIGCPLEPSSYLPCLLYTSDAADE